MGETIMGDFRWFLILFIQRALAAMICWRDSRFQNGRLESPFFTFQDQKNACFKIVLGQPPGFKFNRRLINKKGSIESSSKIIVAFQPHLCLFSFATPTRWQSSQLSSCSSLCQRLRLDFACLCSFLHKQLGS